MSRREELYKGFVIAASEGYGQALMSNELQVKDVIALYAMVSSMRIVSLAPRHRLRRGNHAHHHIGLLRSQQNNS